MGTTSVVNPYLCSARFCIWSHIHLVNLPGSWFHALYTTNKDVNMFSTDQQLPKALGNRLLLLWNPEKRENNSSSPKKRSDLESSNHTHEIISISSICNNTFKKANTIILKLICMSLTWFQHLNFDSSSSFWDYLWDDLKTPLWSP